MNKKLLICGAIATALLITACVKKEEPKQEEQEQVDTSASEAQPVEPAKFESLDSADTQPIEPIPAHEEVIREETPNTTTEIRREVRNEEPATPKAETPKPAPKAEAPKAEDKPAQAAPKQHSGAQTEDDAVAAAIAAATPALDN
ncbi:internalin [Acinetobacter pragensis]|uniref:internalin n=1 Tax=Acinetobacter pragensis TaxID=1806892 RepID=UPI00333ECA70